MSEKKYSENDPERTLITLDQLSQTIEVMTSVVNRLRQHLSEQVTAKREIEALEQAQERARAGKLDDDEQEAAMTDALLDDAAQPGVVVEVSKPEPDLDEAVDEKTLH
ncbi:MAG: hypothetical protein KJN90_08605 [Gammaproteobacteria bacterium]|nr:hypothetical protein [Gammaproteobacteria bacterium]